MKTIISLFAVSLISGCTTTQSSKTLSSPRPHQTKYTVQCLLVTAPDSLIQELIFNDNVAVLNTDTQLPTFELTEENYPTNIPAQTLPIPTLTHPQIEMVLDHPDTEILEFPLVCAGIGESITNEQAKTVEMEVDADIVDGKIVYTKEPLKIGEVISVTVSKAENSGVTCKVDMMHKEFMGFDEYKTEDGLVVKIPCYERRGVNTEITQPPLLWTALGGLIHQPDNEPMMSDIIVIRIIPPGINK